MKLKKLAVDIFWTVVPILGLILGFIVVVGVVVGLLSFLTWYLRSEGGETKARSITQRGRNRQNARRNARYVQHCYEESSQNQNDCDINGPTPDPSDDCIWDSVNSACIGKHFNEDGSRR